VAARIVTVPSIVDAWVCMNRRRECSRDDLMRLEPTDILVGEPAAGGAVLAGPLVPRLLP
jgi:hypothetical protein